MAVSIANFMNLLIFSSLLLSGVYATCNHNNCYRALFPTQSPTAMSQALSFCSSWLQGIHTSDTTGYPTRATSACGTNPSPYSSACSCMVTVTSSSTAASSTTASTSASSSTTSSTTSTTTLSSCSTNIASNPSFESGTDGWQFQLQPNTTWQISSSGFNDQYAFEFDQTGPIASGFHFAQGRLMQAVYPLTTGTTYTLSFATYITPGGAGFWGVLIDCTPEMTVDAMDGKGPGVWNTWNMTFVATDSQTILTFESIASGPGDVFKIDDVSISTCP